MLIGELIEQLKFDLENCGDLPVWRADEDYQFEIEGTEMKEKENGLFAYEEYPKRLIIR